MMLISYDAEDPKNNALIATYHGKLDLFDIILLVVNLASKATGQSKGVAKPTVPILVLKKIVVSLCMADMEINGTTFKQGYTYEFEAIIIGVTIRARVSVSWNGFSAYFGMTKVPPLTRSLARSLTQSLTHWTLL